MSTELAVIPPAAATVLCAQQNQIEITFDEATGDATLIQKNWPDGDSEIHISADNRQAFLDAICDAFGVQSFGGSR